ncbi:Protein SABRE [Carex littledalei]|uniref:Protein SABRE n=1 Tax=Carex littledalei TaxID=544730 RepID=A0A833R3E9_9POAL|nr:Protein SABRE [Carex littledalei]
MEHVLLLSAESNVRWEKGVRIKNLDLKCGDVMINHNITGIQLGSVKLPSHDETGEATSHFDLVREGGTSFLEILKVATVASIDVLVEASSFLIGLVPGARK